MIMIMKNLTIYNSIHIQIYIQHFEDTFHSYQFLYKYK